MKRTIAALALAAAAALSAAVLPRDAAAQGTELPVAGRGVTLQQSAAPAGLPDAVRGVTIDQRLGETMPAGVSLVDESGRPVTLGDYFGRRPVILNFVYYECPMLCTLVLNGVVRALRTVDFESGRDFEVVTISIDPRETPAMALAKKEEYLAAYKRDGAREGWHFLTGGAAAIEELTAAAGFKYTYDEKTGLYAHASGIMILTPQGRLHRYFYGVEYAPRDLRLGLVEASAGRIGSKVDALLLYCFHYDPIAGKYGLAIIGLVRAAGVATALLLGGFIVVMLRRDRARRRIDPSQVRPAGGRAPR